MRYLNKTKDSLSVLYDEIYYLYNDKIKKNKLSQKDEAKIRELINEEVAVIKEYDDSASALQQLVSDKSVRFMLDYLKNNYWKYNESCQECFEVTQKIIEDFDEDVTVAFDQFFENTRDDEAGNLLFNACGNIELLVYESSTFRVKIVIEIEEEPIYHKNQWIKNIELSKEGDRYNIGFLLCDNETGKLCEAEFSFQNIYIKAKAYHYYGTNLPMVIDFFPVELITSALSEICYKSLYSDKYLTEKEKALLPLAKVALFQSSFYMDRGELSEEESEQILKYIKENGTGKLFSMTQQYFCAPDMEEQKDTPFNETEKYEIAEKFATELKKPEAKGLWRKLSSDLKDASEEYPWKDTSKNSGKIKRQIETNFIENGFTGQYPSFVKYQEKNVVFVECMETYNIDIPMNCVEKAEEKDFETNIAYVAMILSKKIFERNNIQDIYDAYYCNESKKIKEIILCGELEEALKLNSYMIKIAGNGKIRRADKSEISPYLIKQSGIVPVLVAAYLIFSVIAGGLFTIGMFLLNFVIGIFTWIFGTADFDMLEFADFGWIEFLICFFGFGFSFTTLFAIIMGIIKYREYHRNQI